MGISINGSTGGGASAPAGTGVVTVSGGAFVDPVASAATTRSTLDAMQDVFTTRGDMVRAGVGAAGTALVGDSLVAHPAMSARNRVGTIRRGLMMGTL